MKYMVNPFDDVTGEFCVLVNHEEQHSLWPVQCAIPSGWTTVFGSDKRTACMEYIETHWTDMRPKSLREYYAAASTA
jgi:MbtH protein